MKKLLSAAVAVLALGTLFVGCASSGAAKETSEGPSIPHPRTYVIDMGEAKDGNVVAIEYNQYGPNYQSTPNPDFSHLLKKDYPKTGDTVVLNWEFTADKDLPVVLAGLVDGSAKANYWRNLADPATFVLGEDIKAGEVVKGSKEIVLAADSVGQFAIYLQYDSEDSIKLGYAKVNDKAVLTFNDIADVATTDTFAELEALGVTTVTGPKTINIQMEKIAAFCEIATNHPWVDGVQDMSKISNYQADVSISSLLDEELAAGDVLNITWHAVSDKDIPVLYARPVDHSQSVGWWNEMYTGDWGENNENVVLARDIKAGVPFDCAKTFTCDVGSDSTDVLIVVWYDYDPETNGPGPALILMDRN